MARSAGSSRHGRSRRESPAGSPAIPSGSVPPSPSQSAAPPLSSFNTPAGGLPSICPPTTQRKSPPHKGQWPDSATLPNNPCLDPLQASHPRGSCRGSPSPPTLRDAPDCPTTTVPGSPLPKPLGQTSDAPRCPLEARGGVAGETADTPPADGTPIAARDFSSQSRQPYGQECRPFMKSMLNRRRSWPKYETQKLK